VYIQRRTVFASFSMRNSYAYRYLLALLTLLISYEPVVWSPAAARSTLSLTRVSCRSMNYDVVML
jgi:hypothetical protein